MSIVLTGTTSLITLWNNVDIVGFEGEPNTGSATTNSLVPYTPDSQTITWNTPSGAIPSFLNGATFSGLTQMSQLNGSNVTITRSILFQITNGSQEQFGLLCEPKLKFTVKNNSGTALISTDILPLNSYQYGGDFDIKNISYCTSSVCPSYTLQLLASGVRVATVNSVPWQSSNGFSCGSRPMRSFGMTARMTVTISINCAGALSSSTPCRSIITGPTGTNGNTGSTGTNGTTGTNGPTGPRPPNPGPPNPGPSGPTGTNQKSWISRYWWIIAIIAAVVLIIIIILIVLLTRGGKEDNDDKDDKDDKDEDK